MTDTHPATIADLADTAAEAIRALNHASLDGRSIDLHELYHALGALATLADRLPQACRQLAAALDGRSLTADDATDADYYATLVRNRLAASAGLARQAGAELAIAHQAAARLYER